jgi:hypothetical protein
VVVAQQSFPPAAPPAFAPMATPPPPASPMPAVEVPRVHAPRSSWWRALLVSTRPMADGEAAPLDDRAARQLVAAASASLGLVVMLLALLIGLREAPFALLVSPVVAASVVIARAAVAVALLVVGMTCLRAAERLYFR